LKIRQRIEVFITSEPAYLKRLPLLELEILSQKLRLKEYLKKLYEEMGKVGNIIY